MASALAQSARETAVWVMADAGAPAQAEAALAARGVEVFRLPAAGGRFDTLAVLRHLAGQGITRLMVEGGPTIAASFLAADLVDEAVLLRGSTPIGPDGIEALEAMPLTALTASPKLRWLGIEKVGQDTVEQDTVEQDTIETFERM